MSLHHIRIPSLPSRLPTYSLAVAVQSKLQARLLEYKTASRSESATAKPPPPPPPTLLSFTPAPTYTLGRRQTRPLSREEEERLRRPLHVQHANPDAQRPASRNFLPEVTSAPRGGLATYHGPGQVVFWPVIDLHSPLHRHFTVRDYACLLEKTTIAALARVTAPAGGDGAGGIQGFTTENPGVWVRHSRTGLRSQGGGSPSAEEHKIAALGVHLSRHVTGLGVAVNVGMPVTGPEESNPWARIVACGLEGKGVTSIMRELYGSPEDGMDMAVAEALREELRGAWAEEFEQRLRINHDLKGDGGGAYAPQLQRELEESILYGRTWPSSYWNDGSQFQAQ